MMSFYEDLVTQTQMNFERYSACMRAAACPTSWRTPRLFRMASGSSGLCAKSTKGVSGSCTACGAVSEEAVAAVADRLMGK